MMVLQYIYMQHANGAVCARPTVYHLRRYDRTASSGGGSTDIAAPITSPSLSLSITLLSLSPIYSLYLLSTLSDGWLIGTEMVTFG